MNENRRPTIDPRFVDVLRLAQAEANRYKVYLTEILILRMLIFENMYLDMFFAIMGVSRKAVKSAVEREWQKYLKVSDHVDEEGSVLTVTNFVDNPDGEKVYLCIDKKLEEIFSNAYGYSVDGNSLNELSFMLTILKMQTECISHIFDYLDIEIILGIRYFQGILFENIQEAFEQMEQMAMQEQFNNLEEELNNDEAFESIEEQENVDLEAETPEKIKKFLSPLKADGMVLGREKEINKLIRIILKVKKRNAILVGKPGVGKTAIVEKLAWLIKKGECPEELKGKTIFSLDLTGLLAGTKYRGDAEKRFKAIIDFLSAREDVILFIDEIHGVVGAGRSEGTNFDLANSLKTELARGNIIVIGATTYDEYNGILCTDKAFKRRFETIEVTEPKVNEVYPMIKEQINGYSKKHNVAITKGVVDFIIHISGCFSFETANPDRTLDIVDKSMVMAKLEGKKMVTNKIVLDNFDANFKKFEEEMSKELKMSTAYHETGHYLVARYGRTYESKALAVSIIPAEGNLGITVWESIPQYIDWDYKAHIQYIAVTLAGRVAEKMFTGKETSGANSDLKKATEEARRILLEYGLKSSFSSRNAEKDFSDGRIDVLNEEIDKIISEAYSYAKTILSEHSDALVKISEKLVEKGILITSELDKICKECEENLVLNI